MGPRLGQGQLRCRQPAHVAQQGVGSRDVGHGDAFGVGKQSRIEVVDDLTFAAGIEQHGRERGADARELPHGADLDPPGSQFLDDPGASRVLADAAPEHALAAQRRDRHRGVGRDPATGLHDAAREVLARPERQPIDREDGVDHGGADADDARLAPSCHDAGLYTAAQRRPCRRPQNQRSGCILAAVALPVDFTQAAAEGAGRQMIGGFDRGSRSPVESGLAATAKPLADAAKRSSILLIADCKSVWISLCRMSNQ
jgi:hypothetical protein